MSQMIDFTVPSTVPGRTLHAFRCVPEGEVRAILQLSHGMVEFIDRYKPLAEYLAGRGILVTGHDHLGHGDAGDGEDEFLAEDMDRFADGEAQHQHDQHDRQHRCQRFVQGFFENSEKALGLPPFFTQSCLFVLNRSVTQFYLPFLLPKNGASVHIGQTRLRILTVI